MAITIDGTTVFQTMLGFGAQDSQATLYTSAVADFFWRTDSGIGMSILGSELFVNQTTLEGWPTYFTVQNSSGVPAQGDFTIEQQAFTRGVKQFYVRCWTPQLFSPYSWLSGGSATGSLLTSFYADMAGAFTTYMTNSWAAGIPTQTIAMMNEPDFTPSGYSQTSWTTAQMLSFIKGNLGPALASWGAANPSWQAATGLTAPGIMISDVTNWSDLSTWTAAIEGDATAKSYVSAYSAHQYQGVASPPVPCSFPIWETEVFDQAALWDATMTDALVVMGYIYAALTTGNAQSWHYWYLEDISDNNNSALIGTDGSNWSNPPLAAIDWANPTYRKCAYAFGQFTKFIRPGWWRINATGAPSGVQVLAFAGPGGQFCAVCINTNGSTTAVTLNFNLSSSQIQVWVTDGSNSLAPQGTLNASSGSVSYTLSASSVTTFLNVANNTVFYGSE